MKCEWGRSGQSRERCISRVVAANSPVPTTPTPQPCARPPGYQTASSAQPMPVPVIKRNDSICALFKFDVFIMHYTIRWIWQFPLYLIKYLCRPEDGSCYQRGGCGGRSAVQMVGLVWEVRQSWATLYAKKKPWKDYFVSSRDQHMQVFDMNNQAHLTEITRMTLHCIWVNQYPCPCMFALGGYTNTEHFREEKATSTLSPLCCWLSQQKVFHQRHFFCQNKFPAMAH